jgi:hypothetical protein
LADEYKTPTEAEHPIADVIVELASRPARRGMSWANLYQETIVLQQQSVHENAAEAAIL